MTAKVGDASAIAAFLFREPAAAQMRQELAGELHVPTVLRYEIANVAIKKLRAHPHMRNDIFEGLAELEALAATAHEVDPTDIVPLAERYGLSGYDAAYLWLARHLGAALVTLDRKLKAAASQA